MEFPNIRIYDNMSQQPQTATEGETSLPASHSVHSGECRQNHYPSINYNEEMATQLSQIVSRGQAVSLPVLVRECQQNQYPSINHNEEIAAQPTQMATMAQAVCPPDSVRGCQQNQYASINYNEEMAAQQSQMASRVQTVNLPHSESEEIPPPKPDFSAPPPYEVATKLPSYEEVQREKTLQGEIPQTHPQIHLTDGVRTPQQPLAILAIDTDGEGDPESRMLGTDFMFFTAFLVAFLFNWIGFLLLMCFCHTIASRYGALSGFGLSLTKWTLIVKHSTDLASRENSWLWWLIMAFGLLICVRAIIQYLNIKRGWRLLSGSAQERLLFYY